MNYPAGEVFHEKIGQNECLYWHTDLAGNAYKVTKKC